MQRIPLVRIEMVRERNLSYESKKVNGPLDAEEILRQFLTNADRETFCILCLDTKNQVNALNVVSIGSLNQSLVHPREVFKAAILANANGIVLCHNHPSGDPSPSPEDKEVTKRLYDAGKLLGIEILDHIILGDYGKYVSLKERGII